MIPSPPKLDDLPAGTQLIAGMGRSTVLADMDFETYSEAGFLWDAATNKWTCLPGAAQGKKGLPIVGAASYAEHPTTEVTSFYYDLKDGRGRRHWVPGMDYPRDLFDHIASGGLVEAWNVAFERWIWNTVCVPKYGWWPLPSAQCRDAMAKSRAFAAPGKLEKAAVVLGLKNLKDSDGDRLLKKFAMPRNPTAKDKRWRVLPSDDPIDGAKLYKYNETDIVVEAEASSVLPDLEGEELEFWLCDQTINTRGVQMDRAGVENCIAIVDRAQAKYNAELYALTGGEVARASELAKLLVWLAHRGIRMESLDDENVTNALERDDKKRMYLDAEEAGQVTDNAQIGLPMPDDCRRALEIRAAIGSASVKKVYAMRNQMTRAGRLHDLFSYHAARTGRVTGNGPQPTNLPNSGPDVLRCGCGKHFGAKHTACPWCNMPQVPGRKPMEWCAAAAVDALEIIAMRSLELLEYFFHDAMYAVSGCLRGLFIAAPGYDLICSDYSAIEAVGLAELSGEEWRREVFRTHGKIYEMSASKITGIPFAEFERYKTETGQHHPMRKKVGKIAELAFGYQGWVGSAVAFGMDEFFTEEEIKKNILAWRATSPAIVELWGGQARGKPWEANYTPELFGVEGAFVGAVMNPGIEYACRGMTFLYRGDILYLKLLSGRYLTYHKPRLTPGGRDGFGISYEGWNTNPKNGAVGWVRMNTWGGRLVENIDQATCRDILRFAIINLECAGYRVVLHVYDEIVAEIPEGWGSIEEFERIMATMPPWAKDWPIKATGGWRSKRYTK